jgi:hypothetical protein
MGFRMTSTRRPIRYCWLLVLALAFALSPAHLAAQDATPPAPEPPSFLLEPVDQDGSYFAITQEPGSSERYTVALGNAGSEPVAALTYVADAYTLVNGGFGVETADDEATEPTTWIDYQTETLDLPADEVVERTFTVTVPDDAAPGQYIAGLAVQTADSMEVGDTGMLRQIIKKSIAVFITVPGPETPELTLGDIAVSQSPSGGSLVIAVSNPGNVFLNPAGTVTMTSAAGDPVLSSPIVMGPVYAHTDTTLELPIPTVLDPGAYEVSVALEDEQTGASAERSGVAVDVAPPAAEATPMANPVTIDAVTVEPLTDPSSDALQAVNVTVSIANDEAAIPGARLTLHVTRDGEPVEDYPLASSVALPNGTTDIQQRYIPLGGWQPGTYGFALTLEAVDATTGQATVLATTKVEQTIEVP